MKYLLFIILLVAVVISAGCTSKGSDTGQPTPAQDIITTTPTETPKIAELSEVQFEKDLTWSQQDAVVYILKWQMENSIIRNDLRGATYYKNEMKKAIHNYIEIDSAITHADYCDKECSLKVPDAGHTQVALALEKCLNENDINSKIEVCKNEWNNFNQSIKNS